MPTAIETPIHRSLGLTDGELQRIIEVMGRDPNHFELAVFSLLWSEHCGYKHSRPELRRLPTSGPRVLQGPGENAGVIDVGDGLALAFKVESHNHPSAVEPYQGAATGVGGILRDIFAMGARPIAILDSLRLGPLDEDRPRRLFDGIVRGVGGYGNCVGVANVGGETVFDAAYRDNPLVNAMALGVLEADQLVRASAAGVGNQIVLYGALTGRDGIGGASVLASQDLDEESAEKRPSVQIGDPFTGKKLLECSLELAHSALVVSLQDLGAAGLASSLAEMAASGEVGLEIELDAVPLREAGMQPFEIMISESQERMAAVVEPSRLAEVQAVCARHELPCTVIGTIIEGDRLVARFAGRGGGRSARRRARRRPDVRARAASARRRWPTSRSRSTRSPSPATLGAARPPARAAERLLQGLGVRAVRPARRLRHRRAPRRGRRRRAAHALRARDRRGARRRRRARRARSPSRRTRGRRTGRAQRRLQRCRPRRDHELPQLRQPRAPGDGVRAARGDHRHGRGLRGLRDAGRLGQRLPLQRALRHADPPDSGRGRGGRARARRARSAVLPARRGRSTAAARRRPRRRTTAASVRRSRTARAPAASRSRPSPSSPVSATPSWRQRAAGCSRPPTTRRTAGSIVAISELCLGLGGGCDLELPELAARGDITLFGEACGNVLVTCDDSDRERLAEICARHAVPLTELGSLGGERIVVRAGSCAVDVALDDVRAAYENALPLAMEHR